MLSKDEISDGRTQRGVLSERLGEHVIPECGKPVRLGGGRVVSLPPPGAPPSTPDGGANT